MIAKDFARSKQVEDDTPASDLRVMIAAAMVVPLVAVLVCNGKSRQ
jgi:hypothetical protein